MFLKPYFYFTEIILFLTGYLCKNLRVVSVTDNLHCVLSPSFLVDTTADCAKRASSYHFLVQCVVPEEGRVFYLNNYLIK